MLCVNVIFPYFANVTYHFPSINSLSYPLSSLEQETKNPIAAMQLNTAKNFINFFIF